MSVPQPGQAPQQPQGPQRVQQAYPPQQYPQRGYQAPPQGYQENGLEGNDYSDMDFDPRVLAIQPKGSAQDQQAGRIAAQRGFIKKPPDWIKHQATERCPNCGGVDFARSGDSEGSYGKLRRTKIGGVEFGRCFDCGYTMNGGNPMSAAQEGNQHNLATGGRIQATRQAHGLGQNFFEIRVDRAR